MWETPSRELSLDEMMITSASLQDIPAVPLAAAAAALRRGVSGIPGDDLHGDGGME